MLNILSLRSDVSLVICSATQATKDFKNAVNNLKVVKEHLQLRVDERKRSGQAILREVNTWLETVDQTSEESDKFFNEELQANIKCASGLCLNLWSAHQLSRKAKKNTATVEQLKQKSRFDQISEYVPPIDIRTRTQRRATDLRVKASHFD